MLQGIGIAGGLPVPGGFLGTGRESLAIYYPEYGVFANFPSLSGYLTAKLSGIPGLSLPSVGDFDGSGRTELGF